jgi:hypothetical protein
MGQYYKVVILAENGTTKKDYIRFYIDIWCGMKLLEHSYLKNDFVNTIEYLLSPFGSFYKSRIVWAGDYADVEKDSNMNFYTITDCDDESDKVYRPKRMLLDEEYIYIVNHTKKQFIDKSKYLIINPLPLITAEGNGRGGGDYYGSNEQLIGSWSRDVISIEKEVPDDFSEFTSKFGEDKC